MIPPGVTIFPNLDHLLGWCKNTPRLASVPHEVMAAVVGGISRYAAQYLSDTAEEVVRLNAAIKIATLQFELPKDLSNVAVRSGKGLKLLADIRVLCCDSVVVTLAQLTHHCLAVIKGEWRAMLDDLHNAVQGVR